MQALVTGGGGFLGRHIVNKLRARGDSVRVLGRRAYPDLTAEGVECVQADLADPDSVAAACAGCDAVFHVAAKAGVWGSRASYYRPNVTGTEAVLAGCKRYNVPRLIYTSTPSVVYGDHAIDGGDETLPYPKRFLTFYAETKSIAERMVLGADSSSFSTCSLRPHLIWGPGDNNLIPRIVDRARAGRLMRVGDGTNRVSVSYVENIADAHLAAADRLETGSPVCGQAYFVNEEEPVSCWDFIDTVLMRVGAPPIRKSLPLWLAYTLGATLEGVARLTGRKDDPLMTRFLALQLATSHWFRIDKAKRDLDWSPRVSMEDGLDRLAASFGTE